MSIEEQIARKVIELLKEEGLIVAASSTGTPKKSGGKSPPKETTPKDVDDGHDEDDTAGAAADEPAPDEGEGDEETDDLVTEEQVEWVTENINMPDEDAMRAELLDFYVAQGDDAQDTQNTLAAMEEEELTNAYIDYCARLIIHQDDGSIKDLTEDMGAPYKSVRTFGDETKLYWCQGGLVMSAEEVEEAGLGDPNAKKKTPRKRATTRKPTGKKK